MLRLADLPGWLRGILGVVYLIWALIVTAFGAYVVIRSFDFGAEVVEPTTETIVLLAGLLVAPLLPFVQRILFPGGGGVDFDDVRTREAGRTAAEGIGQAAIVFELPPLEFASEEEGAND